MNREDSRLRTFENWPENAPVDPQRIAKAGFYFTGRNMEVECFCCGGKIQEWNYGDQVMARHRELSPSCPFVHNPASSGNVPIILSSPSFDGSVTERSSTPATAAPSESSSLPRPPFNSSQSAHLGMYNHSFIFRREALRLDTFRNWPIPHIVSPQRLAKAGFFYQGTGDQVKCAFCGGCVTLWEEGDDPEREHRRHFPTCPFLHNIPVGNVSLEEDSNHFTEWGVQASSGDTTLGMKELGIQSHHGPMCPQLSTVESRLRTFSNWPDNVVQRPNELAAAGFYYTGNGDQVKCFHCDGGLRLWDPSDDPWMEHARWFNCCPFVLLVKGEEFVRQAVTQSGPPSEGTSVPDTSQSAPDPLGKAENSVVNSPTPTAVPPSRVAPPTDTPRSTTPPPQPPQPLQPPQPPTPERAPGMFPKRQPGRALTEEELQPYMNSPMVAEALATGLDFPRIKMAVRRHVERTGQMFVRPDSLVEAALDVQQLQEMNAFELSSFDDDFSPLITRSRRNRSSQDRIEVSHSEHDGWRSSRLGQSRSSEENKRRPEQRLQDTDNLNISSQGSATGTMSQSLPSLARANNEPQKPTEKSGSSLLSRQSLPALPSEGEDISNMLKKVSLEEENRRLREARLCKICMDNDACVVFLPCGHLVTCVNCAPSLAHCPICRQLIKATVRTFMS